jgi:hypothetical protein
VLVLDETPVLDDVLELDALVLDELVLDELVSVVPDDVVLDAPMPLAPPFPAVPPVVVDLPPAPLSV